MWHITDKAIAAINDSKMLPAINSNYSAKAEELNLIADLTDSNERVREQIQTEVDFVAKSQAPSALLNGDSQHPSTTANVEDTTGLIKEVIP